MKRGTDQEDTGSASHCASLENLECLLLDSGAGKGLRTILAKYLADSGLC